MPLSSLCLLEGSCHEQDMVHELLALPKQIDPGSALSLFQATKGPRSVRILGGSHAFPVSHVIGINTQTLNFAS